MTFLNLNHEPHHELRRDVIATALKMNVLGINQGKSGNVSVRVPRESARDESFLITPTGIAYEKTRPEDIVEVRMDGGFSGDVLPSSEWRFHRDIYAARSDVDAIVHTHSAFATTIAVHGKDIPAFHYMIAVAGGDNIRCAPYATFGTQALSDAAVMALKDRKACLLAQHGMIACEASLEKALALAEEVESLAKMYWQALQLGAPPILSDAEMTTVIEKFKTYGQQPAN
jgi:L-fuculose-phosphate aldolase